MVIQLPIQVSGAGASAQNIAAASSGISQYWSGTFGDLEVDTQVVTGAENKIVLSSDATRSFVNMPVGGAGDSGTWGVDNIDWVPAHEAGHLMGLGDRYVDVWESTLRATISAPFGTGVGNIMGTWGARPSAADIQQALGMCKKFGK